MSLLKRTATSKPKSKPSYVQEKGALLFREYGRNVQQMVEHVLTIKDKEKRLSYCREIVRIMSHILPGQKDSPEQGQKLWDHLHIMSGFKLDVNSPYPPPEKDVTRLRHTKPPRYRTSETAYKEYGKNVELMIEKAKEMEPGLKRDAYLAVLANTMKIGAKLAGKELSDDVVIEHIAELSNHIIELDPENVDIRKYSKYISKTPQSFSSKAITGQKLAMRNKKPNPINRRRFARRNDSNNNRNRNR